MSYFSAKLILLAERIRVSVLNCVKYYWLIDAVMPMIPAIFDIL